MEQEQDGVGGEEEGDGGETGGTISEVRETGGGERPAQVSLKTTLNLLNIY